ncbi:MAG: creatininase family protein [Lachnospiraceae bacterium]|nr:creatininase family protein [Lachnospiraceae bacterium]
MFTSIFEDTMVTCNWLEIENAAADKIPVLFPLGVIEEHGPHLTLASDINWSYCMCKMVKDKLQQKGCESIIAPPYYWGINHCTGGFPGSFSLKMETMQQVLFELFENLQNFGFAEVYCFSYHGDPAHVRAIEGAIRKANDELDIQVRLVVEAMDLRLYGWKGDEDFLLVSNPPYPMEWFEEQDPSEQELYDIHAGAFETAVMNCMCPEQVDLKKACELKSSSLTKEGMKKWRLGGEATKEVVPLGYAGNPAGYEMVSKHVEEMLDLQAEDIANGIVKFAEG